MNRALPLALILGVASTTVINAGAPARAAVEISAEQRSELALSYSLMASEFYKSVAPQTLFDGVHDNLLAYLKKGGVASPALPKLFATDNEHANVTRLQSEVSTAITKYGAKVGSKPITWAAIAGMLGSVHDKYTVFLDPKEYGALNQGLDGGNFGGVGISIRVDQDTHELTVIDVIPGTPGEKAGLQSGDTIMAIDGKPAKGLKVDEDSHLLRGKPGSTVRLTIRRDGKVLPAPISVVRATIHEPSVFAHMMNGDVGYVRLSVFGATTSTELGDALHKLDTEGAKAYILDLRDNGGGYLNAAIGVSSKFIDAGPIVTVVSRASGRTEYDADATALPPHPLAVLVNKYTASASEITSGALQDDGVGTLVGERTFGKGVVQTIHPLPDGSAVKITTARYLTPLGRDINSVGIKPDITEAEPKNARFGDPTTDPQLRTALGYLKDQIAKRDS
ncbi:MAG: S41 family peptidase [Vulcanimicrobiaceae bacterium]